MAPGPSDTRNSSEDLRLKEFESFYRDIYPSLFRYAIFILKDSDEANIAINDVFLRLWRIEVVPTHKKAFVFRAVKNAAINQLKARKNRLHILEHEDLPEQEDFTSNALAKMLDRDRQQSLYSLIDKMPEKRRLVFHLHRLQGFSYKEISELMNISVRTVEDHLIKGMEQLRQLVVSQESELR
ncbi:sigma-70 family RNA polymerase sigma factor [Desertivirga brevis]|uniref:sigma-70 family RNA polymerase sigma factor n=1 Tax=Desertivirga brevis TaxID=2810310 RepID=UPI001A970FD5|nr:sigma-70 family RNA polymerase sigma factor [Pedobacter sp. SYSU D00873]